jgi:hypothetical protein
LGKEVAPLSYFTFLFSNIFSKRHQFVNAERKSLVTGVTEGGHLRLFEGKDFFGALKKSVYKNFYELK